VDLFSRYINFLIFIIFKGFQTPPELEKFETQKFDRLLISSDPNDDETEKDFKFLRSWVGMDRNNPVYVPVKIT